MGSTSWVCGSRRRGPRGARPAAETEKQVMPAVEPPFATHARRGSGISDGCYKIGRGGMGVPVLSLGE